MDAALGLLQWDDANLAAAADLRPKSISRLRRAPSPHRRMYRRRVEMLEKIHAALEEAGVRFLECGGVEPRRTCGPLPS